MKKSIIKLTAILFLGVSMFSCEKEEIQPTTSSTSFFTATEKANGTRRIWYDNGKIPGEDGIDFGCKGVGGNCLEDVVVKPSSFAVFEDLNNASNNDDLIEVKRIISENFNTLSDYISSEDLDKVLNESSILKTRGEVSEGTKLYILFESNEIINVVYPMNF